MAGRMNRADALARVLDALDRHGFVGAGGTRVDHVRVHTERSPVIGGHGGEARAFGGRARFALPGTDLRATVGKVTTYVYRVGSPDPRAVVPVGSHDTTDFEGILATLARAGAVVAVEGL